MKFNYKEIYTKSNLLSLFRLFLAIPYWILLDNLDVSGMRYFIIFLCLFGSATDILDGYLARKFNEITELGKIIDPLADKVAVGAIMIKLFLLGLIPPYYFFIILGRDALIFIGGIIVSNKIGKVLPSNMLGKITVLSIGIVILLIIGDMSRSSYIFLAFYGLSIILVFASLIGYIIRALEFIRRKEYESV